MAIEASEPSLFTAVSAYSLAGVLSALIIAQTASSRLLPKNAGLADRVTFVWLAFDAMIHFTLEGSFLYHSTFGRTVATSTSVLAEAWKEYARADYRWALADETVVSLELLTVFGAGPLCCLILWQLLRGDPARHYWIVVLSTAELYGGFMTFCPEWLTGNKNLETSNFLYFWVYLVFMNMLWVVIPLWLMWDSYSFIVGTLRSASGSKLAKKQK